MKLKLDKIRNKEWNFVKEQFEFEKIKNDKLPKVRLKCSVCGKEFWGEFPEGKPICPECLRKKNEV